MIGGAGGGDGDCADNGNNETGLPFSTFRALARTRSWSPWFTQSTTSSLPLLLQMVVFLEE